MSYNSIKRDIRCRSRLRFFAGIIIFERDFCEFPLRRMRVDFVQLKEEPIVERIVCSLSFARRLTSLVADNQGRRLLFLRFHSGHADLRSVVMFDWFPSTQAIS